MHVTVVVPTGRSDPLVGEQVSVTGGFPLVTATVPNVTAVGNPSGDCALCDAGQEIEGATLPGDVGLEQAVNWSAAMRSRVPQALRRTVRGERAREDKP